LHSQQCWCLHKHCPSTSRDASPSDPVLLLPPSLTRRHLPSPHLDRWQVAPLPPRPPPPPRLHTYCQPSQPAHPLPPPTASPLAGGLVTTTSSGRSLHFSSGMAITAASITCTWQQRSRQAMWPPCWTPHPSEHMGVGRLSCSHGYPSSPPDAWLCKAALDFLIATPLNTQFSHHSGPALQPHLPHTPAKPPAPTHTPHLRVAHSSRVPTLPVPP
jgi:hypothetical protein